MEIYDVIVVGAGISGMSFAHYTEKAHLNTLVIEKSERIGGSFQTSIFNSSRNNYWIEIGAHTCYNSYRDLLKIMEDCGIANQITPRAKVPFRLLVDNDIKSFTSQINFLQVLTNIPKIFSKKKEGETVESYYGSILGKKNFKKVFSALFSAVPSQNADEFPADALFKKRERRKDILKHFTLKNGLESIISSIAKNDNITIKQGVKISGINKIADGFQIKTENGEFVGRNIAVCTSLPEVPLLISDYAPRIAEKISIIKHQSIESFGVIVPKEASGLKPFAGLVPIDDDFFSAVSRDTIPDDEYRGFTFHFKPGILDKAQKMKKACTVLGINDDQIVESMEKINIVPALRLGHYDLIDEIDQLLTDQNLFLSGNYFAGLSIEDCVSRSKAETERLVKSIQQ